MSIQQRLKCLQQSAKRREHRGSISSILLNFKISIILLFISYFLLPGSYLAFAGGKVYWTPNGVLLTSHDGGIEGLADDMNGGGITFSFDGDSVYAIRVDRNGNLPWGLQGKTMDNYDGLQSQPIGVSDGRGGTIAVWYRDFPQKLYYQRVDSMGNRMWSSNAQRVTLSDSAQRKPAAVSNGAGGMIIAWQEARVHARGLDIYAQRIDSSGTRLWGDYGVPVCTADSSQTYPAITCDNAGNSVIVWWDARNGDTDIYSQRLDINGSPLWTSNGIPVCNNDSLQTNAGYGSTVVMATDTTIIYVWHDGRNGNGDIYAQCLNVNGMPLWAMQGIPVCDTINTQGGGQIVADGKGGAVFCWIDQRNGYWNLYAQRLNSNGQKLWDSQGISICTTDSAYWYQRIVTDGNSGAIICWQDKRSGNWDIYAQHVDSIGNILWDTNGMAVCTAVNYQQNPYVIASDSGRAIIVWDDGRTGGGTRGYAQKMGDEIIGIEEEMTDNRWQMTEISLQIYPNPFSEKTDIRYMIQDSRLKISL